MDKRFTSDSLAALYKSSRPSYPQSLYKFIRSAVTNWRGLAKQSDTTMAVDLGCGPGLATGHLLDFFDHVVGIDSSPAQLRQAEDMFRDKAASNIQFVYGTATSMPLPTESCNYIQVFTAAHWFDLPRFYDEADRVLAPGGVLVMCTYSPTIGRILEPQSGVTDKSEVITNDIKEWYEFLTENDYNGNKTCVYDLQSLYQHWTLPYPEENHIRRFDMTMQQTWTIDRLAAYVRTLSGSQVYSEKFGDGWLHDMKQRWQQLYRPDQELIVEWPLGLLMTHKPLHSELSKDSNRNE